ncbi:MAG TPA: hypothetical protein VGE42_06660, partial [Candidatus Dormibacteraeota bacterium]
MGIRARRRAGVMVGLAGMLGGALVGLSTVDGATVPPGHGGPGVGAKAAATPTGGGSSGSSTRGGGTTGSPTHTVSGGSTGSPTHSFSSSPTSPPTLKAVAGRPSSSPGSSPVSSPQGSPSARTTPNPSPRGVAQASPSPTAAPRSPAASTRPSPTALSGSNNRNPNWKHDSTSWRSWDGTWQDPNFRQEHNRDSRHQRFEDSSHRFHDDFHFDEFRNEDSNFRHDCDVLLSVHSVR